MVGVRVDAYRWARCSRIQIFGISFMIYARSYYGRRFFHLLTHRQYGKIAIDFYREKKFQIIRYIN